MPYPFVLLLHLTHNERRAPQLCKCLGVRIAQAVLQMGIGALRPAPYRRPRGFLKMLRCLRHDLLLV